VYVGLTTDPNDTLSFAHGYCICIMAKCEQPKAKDFQYWVGSQHFEVEEGLCVAVCDKEVVVLQNGRKLHTMRDDGRFAKPKGSAGKIHAKVFMANSSDEINVAAYEEHPDTGGDWSSAFKLPDAVQRLNPIKRGLSVRSIITPRNSLGNDRKGFGREQSIQEGDSPKSPLPKSASRYMSNPQDHSTSASRDMSSLLGWLAVVEQEDGPQALRLALQAAASSVQRSCSSKSTARLGQLIPTPRLDAALLEYIQKNGKTVVDGTESEPVLTHKNTKVAAKLTKAGEYLPSPTKAEKRKSGDLASEALKIIQDDSQVRKEERKISFGEDAQKAKVVSKCDAEIQVGEPGLQGIDRQVSAHIETGEGFSQTDTQSRDDCAIDVAIARARSLATTRPPWKAATPQPLGQHHETVVEI
jgi:hypothetical protein